MITRENLIEAANRLYENINIEFVNGDNPYWDIQSANPEEIDEDITVAKLYYEVFSHGRRHILQIPISFHATLIIGANNLDDTDTYDTKSYIQNLLFLNKNSRLHTHLF